MLRAVAATAAAAAVVSVVVFVVFPPGRQWQSNLRTGGLAGRSLGPSVGLPLGQAARQALSQSVSQKSSQGGQADKQTRGEPFASRLMAVAATAEDLSSLRAAGETLGRLARTLSLSPAATAVDTAPGDSSDRRNNAPKRCRSLPERRGAWVITRG